MLKSNLYESKMIGADEFQPMPKHRQKVVAYIRYTSNPLDAGRQLTCIKDYCADRGYQLLKVFKDSGKPSWGLSGALEALNEADALIAVDLDRFIEHEGDRIRDLRPFVHNFFGYRNKHLIVIKEGIDTGLPLGQMNSVELISNQRISISNLN
jgi:DNA invertase Pin-like site-specific DNA recombinase